MNFINANLFEVRLVTEDKLETTHVFVACQSFGEAARMAGATHPTKTVTNVQLLDACLVEDEE